MKPDQDITAPLSEDELRMFALVLFKRWKEEMRNPQILASQYEMIARELRKLAVDNHN